MSAREMKAQVLASLRRRMRMAERAGRLDRARELELAIADVEMLPVEPAKEATT
jgi:predicted DNA-binding protein (UPF0278 family)